MSVVTNAGWRLATPDLITPSSSGIQAQGELLPLGDIIMSSLVVLPSTVFLYYALVFVQTCHKFERSPVRLEHTFILL